MSCSRQNVPTKSIDVQEGILLYYMHEPYFFLTIDTAIEKITKANLVGLKLSKIDLNDVYDTLSHKHEINIYVAGDKNKIDTIKTSAGILAVRMKTSPTKTLLSPDSSAFSFVYGKEEWVFRYEIRFDKEVISIIPVLPSDADALKSFIKRREN